MLKINEVACTDVADDLAWKSEMIWQLSMKVRRKIWPGIDKGYLGFR
jgi:hypothetical protein